MGCQKTFISFVKEKQTKDRICHTVENQAWPVDDSQEMKRAVIPQTG